MKTYFKLYISLLSIIISGTSGICQTISSELMNIRKTYYEPKGEIKYSVKILFYDLKNLNQVEDSSLGHFYITKGKSFMEIENMTTIVNDSLWLRLDDNSNTISIGKSVTRQLEKQLSLGFVDSVFNANEDKITLSQADNKGYRKIKVMANDGSIDSISIEYSSTSYLIKSIGVYYRQSIDPDTEVKPVLKISFFNQKILAKATPEHYDFGKYVQVDKKKITLREAYKSYRLINNLIL